MQNNPNKKKFGFLEQNKKCFSNFYNKIDGIKIGIKKIDFI